MSEHDEDCECCKPGGRAKFLAKIEADIKQYGCSMIATSTVLTDGAELNMVYSIGLSDIGLPELIVFGLPHPVAHAVLNMAAREARGSVLKLDTPLDEFSNHPVIFKSAPAEAAADYIVQANNRAGRDLPVIQMIWSDRNNRFPWEPGFDERMRQYQPLLFQVGH